jgi:hypothetical protein
MLHETMKMEVRRGKFWVRDRRNNELNGPFYHPDVALAWAQLLTYGTQRGDPRRAKQDDYRP